RFFEQWVFRAGHPELDVKIEYETRVLSITVRQKQHASATHAPPSTPEAHTPLFAFDLAFDIGEANGRVRREVRRVDQAAQTFAFQLAERPRFVVVDPDFGVLNELRVEAPGDMLRAQLAIAPTARGRWLAAAGLARIADGPTLEALRTSLADDR